MSTENFALGARQRAVDAALLARPDEESARKSPLRKAVITADNGVTCTVQLLGDDGQVIKNAEGDPIELTRVPKFPQESDPSGCVLWYDNHGICYVLQTGGGGCTHGIFPWGVLVD